MGIDLGIDLDDVTYDYTNAFIAFLNKKFNTAFTYADIKAYSFEESGLIPVGRSSELMEEFRRIGGLRLLSTLPKAAEIIRKLATTKTLCYITARPSWTKDDTLYTLERDGILADVHFSTRTKTKAMIIAELGIKKFIDDNPLYLKEIAEGTNAAPIMFSNIQRSIQQSAGFYRNLVHSWDEVDGLFTTTD